MTLKLYCNSSKQSYALALAMDCSISQYLPSIPQSKLRPSLWVSSEPPAIWMKYYAAIIGSYAGGIDSSLLLSPVTNGVGNSDAGGGNNNNTTMNGCVIT